MKAIDLVIRKVTSVDPRERSFFVRFGDAVRDPTRLGGDRKGAQRGQLPPSALGTEVVLTGTVVGVDLSAHTTSPVDPAGDLVLTFAVTDPCQHHSAKPRQTGIPALR